MTVADVNSIYGIYVTYYGRAADRGGLEYWTDQGVNKKVSLESIAAGFAGAQESKDRYPYLAFPTTSDPTEFVKSIYRNAFGREAEAAGLAFWVNELKTKGSGQAPTFILTVLINAQGTDRTALQNKADIAKRFTNGLINNNISPTAQIFTDSTDILNTIKETPESVTAGNASVDAKITSYTSTGTIGKTTTLTSSADNFIGSVGNDTFVGVVDPLVAANNTLQAGDKIDGGTGIDTFIYTGYANGGVFPSLSNVEKVQLLNTTADTINLSALAGKGVQDVTLVNPNPTGGTLNVSGLSGITLGVEGAVATAGATPSTTIATVKPDFGTATSGTVSIKDAVFTTLDLSAGNASVTTLNIVADGLGKNKIGTLTTSAATTALNISGVGTLEITTLPAAVTKIDATTNIGGVIITGTAPAGVQTTITGGEGKDKLTGSAAVDTIDGGGDIDTIIGGLGADTLTGGAGKDIFQYLATADSTGGTLTGNVSFDTIKDFAVADDILKLAGLTSAANLKTQTSVENALGAIGINPLFTLAVSTASVFIGANNFGAFRFANNTYVLGNDANPLVVNDSDQLIALTGSLTLTNTNLGL